MMRKYLLWLICYFRGHIWIIDAIGKVGETWNEEGLLCQRAKCQRCNMHRLVEIVKNPLKAGYNCGDE